MTMPEINRRQAMVPRGATVLAEPERHRARACGSSTDGTAIVLLPGPPREMKPMLEAVIARAAGAASGGRGLFRRVLKITGRAESDVDAQAQPVYGRGRRRPMPISTTILAVLGQIELHLTAQAREPAPRPTRRSTRRSRELQRRARAIGLQRRRTRRSRRSSAICCARAG